MSLEPGDSQEEQPALVPSLFPRIPPTLYFSTANEKGQSCNCNIRSLLSQIIDLQLFMCLCNTL